jgi:glycosyltransferase involved in cell wall biosynthesis
MASGRRLDAFRLHIGRLRARLGPQEAEPLVSVVVPTFNRGPLLAGRTLPAALAQTYRRTEIIIVGDACTDDTEDRILALGDPRLRFENLAERGRYPEDPLLRWMVAGTKPANRGDWIAFLDDDDVWEPDHLESLVSVAWETGAEFVYGAGLLERSPGEWLRIGGSPPATGKILHSAVLYRGYLRFLRYDPEAWQAGIGGDAHLWCRMQRLGVRFAFIDRVVSCSPLRPGEDLRGQRAAERARAEWSARLRRAGDDARADREPGLQGHHAPE